MSSQANVNSIQAIGDVKAALAVFIEQASGAMEEVDLEVHRVLDWVLNEQPPYWQRQIREREERVTQARIDLQRCRMFRVTRDHTPDCTEQKVALRRAEQQLEEAREKLKLVREWGRQLPTAIDEYQAQAQQLGTYLIDDLARAMAALDHMTGALDAYLSVAPSVRVPAAEMHSQGPEKEKEKQKEKENESEERSEGGAPCGELMPVPAACG